MCCGQHLYLFLQRMTAVIGAQWLRDRVLEMGGSLVQGTVLCPRARHFVICLVLVQPRKTCKCLDMTEKK